jgi:hypothetical protein
MIKSQVAKYCLAFALGIILASIICNYVGDKKGEASCDCETEKTDDKIVNEGSKCSSGVSQREGRPLGPYNIDPERQMDRLR